MITLADFELMDETQHIAAVWDATFLGDRSESKFIIQLYSINNFYVEAYYNRKESKITDFKAFKSSKRLVPYLNDISLNGEL